MNVEKWFATSFRFLAEHALHYGLQMLWFFGAIGTIVIVLLTLDALGRFLLYAWRVRSKRARSKLLKYRPSVVAEDDEGAGTTVVPTFNLLDRDLARIEEIPENVPNTDVSSTNEDALPCDTAPR